MYAIRSYYESLVKGLTEAGSYDIEYTISGGVLTSATINGDEALVSGWEITGAYGTSASGMAVRVEDQSDGTHTAEVGVKEGKIPELIAYLEEITDDDTGTLSIIDDNYQDIMDSLDKKIEYEEARLELKQQTLTERYARLEEALSTYSQLQSQLESSIAQLSS